MQQEPPNCYAVPVRDLCVPQERPSGMSGSAYKINPARDRQRKG
jgi:hypothetical protein